MTIPYCRFSVHFSIDHVTQWLESVGRFDAYHQAREIKFAFLLPLDGLIQTEQILSFSHVDTVVLSDVNVGEIARVSTRPVYVIIKAGTEEASQVETYVKGLKEKGLNILPIIFFPEKRETFALKVKELIESNGGKYLEGYTRHRKMGWNYIERFTNNKDDDAADVEVRSHFQPLLAERQHILFGPSRILWTEKIFIAHAIKQLLSKNIGLQQLCQELISYFLVQGERALQQQANVFPGRALRAAHTKLTLFKSEDSEYSRYISLQPVKPWPTASEQKTWLKSILNSSNPIAANEHALNEIVEIFHHISFEEVEDFLRTARLSPVAKSALSCWNVFKEFLRISMELRKIGANPEDTNEQLSDKLLLPAPLRTRSELEAYQVELLEKLDELLPTLTPSHNNKDQEVVVFVVRTLIEDLQTSVHSFYLECLFFLAIQTAVQKGLPADEIYWNASYRLGMGPQVFHLLTSKGRPFLRTFFRSIDVSLRNASSKKSIEILAHRVQEVLESRKWKILITPLHESS